MRLAKQGCCQRKSAAPVARPLRAAAGGGLFRFSGRALSSTTAVFALLLPKCPLCFAAWAATLGVGATGQHYLTIPWLRPVLMGFLVAPLLVQLAFAARFGLRRLRARSAGGQDVAHPVLRPALSSVSRIQE